MDTHTFTIERPHNPTAAGTFRTTFHAEQRMSERGVSCSDLEAALTYGRPVWARGARIYAIGHKEVERYTDGEVDLTSQEGVQAVCHPDGTVLTVYRNSDFRSLRPARRSPRTRGSRRGGDRARKKR